MPDSSSYRDRIPFYSDMVLTGLEISPKPCPYGKPYNSETQKVKQKYVHTMPDTLTVSSLMQSRYGTPVSFLVPRLLQLHSEIYILIDQQIFVFILQSSPMKIWSPDQPALNYCGLVFQETDTKRAQYS